jgi:hypothetical protein
MAERMRRLAETAKMPNVTIQVLPAVAHPAGASGFIIALTTRPTPIVRPCVNAAQPSCRVTVMARYA